MKRDHIILLSLLLTMMLLSAGNVGAQVPANLARLFDGPYHDNRNATETIITGEPLRRHHLSLFRSLSVTEDADLAAPIECGESRRPLSPLEGNRHQRGPTPVGDL